MTVALGVGVGSLSKAPEAHRPATTAVRAAVRGADLDAAGAPPALPGGVEAFVTSVRRALYGSKIAAYAQGFDEIATASKQFGWNIDLGAMARIWRGSCIIHARFLDDITRAYDENPTLASLLTAPVFASSLASVLPDGGGLRQPVPLHDVLPDELERLLVQVGVQTVAAHYISNIFNFFPFLPRI